MLTDLLANVAEYGDLGFWLAAYVADILAQGEYQGDQLTKMPEGIRGAVKAAGRVLAVYTNQ